MNSDATEAALGLLGLSPFNTSHQSHPQPQTHLQHNVAQADGPSLTSTGVGIAIDQASAPHIIQSALPISLVPLKRKQPSPAAASPIPSTSSDGPPTKPRQASHSPAVSPPLTSTHLLPYAPAKSTASSQPQPQQRLFSPILTGSVLPQTSPTTQLSLTSPSASHHPHSLPDVPPPPDSEAISCICGFTYDDGFSIACDDCSRWCHAACFSIVQGGEVPEFWKCWVCDPTVEVDKERAVKIQKGRLRNMRMKASHGTNGGTPGVSTNNTTGVNSVVDEGCGSSGKPASRRKTSPGAERKSRRGSAVAAAIEGSGSSKKKRRASMLSPADPSTPSAVPSAQLLNGNSRISHPNGNAQATPPAAVTFPPDTYPNPSIYTQLLRVAKAWRGVTALNPPSPLTHHPPKTYRDRGYARVDSQGYRDHYGYSMSPLDNATPVMLDENAGDVFVPRTVLRTDPTIPSSFPPAPTCTPAHLRPASPGLYVASDPSPFPHTSIYPSPPASNYTSPPVPSSSHSRSYIKSPLTPSTNTVSSSNPNNTIPATTLLAPYTASIIPSAAYLADPLNGYAHLGMAKPQVKLVGGGWGVGLDARGVGESPDLCDPDKANGADGGREDVEGKAKWARCGCWPNAVVRPVICSGTKGGKGRRKRMRHNAGCAKATSDDAVGRPPRLVNGGFTATPTPQTPKQQTDDFSDQDESPLTSDPESDPMSLSFALFALRDLRADEEIVLGWEWDDGHAVHMLPALMESPGMFAPAHLHHLRAQFTSILHALSSTFTTCACGSSTRDCAVRVMERVVEGRWPWPGGEMTSETSEGDSSDINGASEELDECEGDIDVEGDAPYPSRKWGLGMNVDVDIDIEASIEVDSRTKRGKKRKVRKKNKMEDATLAERGIDLGPLVGVKRGFRTREKVPMNGGWEGVEIVPSSLRPFPEVATEDPQVDDNNKGKAPVVDDKDSMDIDPSPSTLPPRMRKAWSRPATSQPEPPLADLLQDQCQCAEDLGAHERWRSPPDISIDSPISAPGIMEGGFGNQDGPKQSSTNVSGDGDGRDIGDEQETEFDTETEVDGSDDTRQMPPPPMPASLDPTTVSSLAHAHAVRGSSPHVSILRDKNAASVTRLSPRNLTPTSVSLGLQSQSSSQGACAGASAPSISSQGNFCSSPPSLFPPALQAQPSNPTSPPSVSPSATFSQLSLHSPDASSSPHPSASFGPTESTLLPTASTPLHHAPDLRASSPSLHRPSKPLHVHPHNESPSFPIPIPVPVVMSSSPNGVRDTPAEAQYQQSYRSSPESRHDTSDVEKKHPNNGEVFRVRFTSPEILCGLPGLRGNTMSERSEPVADEAVSADVSMMTVASKPDDVPLDPPEDAMDVDVDVVGDDQKQDGSGPSCAASPDSGMDHTQEDKCPSPHIPGSPRSRAPSHSLPQTNVTADGVEPENNVPEPASSDVHESTSHTEPVAMEHEPMQLAREPSPPPPPKVKMSLKDFALRKKKQREEEMAAKALHSPVTPDGPELPFSPNVDVKQELFSGHAGIVQNADTSGAVNGHDAKPNDVTKNPEANTSGIASDGGHEHDERTKVKAIAEDDKLSAEVEAPDTMQSLHSPSSSSHALDERNDRDQTQMQIDSKPTTLTTKIEMMDATIPSGLVGIDDRTPEVVSFAPEPPPPPSTTKRPSETTLVDPIGSTRRSAPPSTSASTPTSMSTSTSTSAVNSRSNSVGTPSFLSNPPLPAHAATPSSSGPPSRRPSHEDGEITGSTSSKSYLPRSHTPPTQPRSFHTAHPSSPSFGSTSSTAPVPRRPPPPLSRSPLSNGTGPTVMPISSRPLPSGPRALRGSMNQPTHSPFTSTRPPPYTGSQYIPRGPSADRDRSDWDRGDRQWPVQARSRGRAGSNGWGR